MHFVFLIEKICKHVWCWLHWHEIWMLISDKHRFYPAKRTSCKCLLFGFAVLILIFVCAHVLILRHIQHTWTVTEFIKYFSDSLIPSTEITLVIMAEGTFEFFRWFLKRFCCWLCWNEIWMSILDDVCESNRWSIKHLRITPKIKFRYITRVL